MKASLLYRVSSILLVLFAIGHTLGFRQIDPTWGVDSLVQYMKSIHFNANGANRTYWEFFVGFGLFVTVLMLFASIIAWQFGGLPSEVLAAMRVSALGVRGLFCRGRLSKLALFLHRPGRVFDRDLFMSRGCGVAFRRPTLNDLPVPIRRVRSSGVTAKSIKRRLQFLK